MSISGYTENVRFCKTGVRLSNELNNRLMKRLSYLSAEFLITDGKSHYMYKKRHINKFTIQNICTY